MRETSRRLRREWRTLRIMVRMYCRHHHSRGACDDCDELLAYARRRLDRCPFGADKPTCAVCPIHCYRPEARERVKRVMRWAGPRMLLRHPVLAILHLVDERRPAPALPSRRAAAAGSSTDS